MQGRKMCAFEAKHPDTTYMTDVSALAAGTYLLVLRVNGDVVQAERIVKKND